MKKKYILVFIFLSLLMNTIFTQALSDGYYYSPKLKKGKVLKWETKGTLAMWQPKTPSTKLTLTQPDPILIEIEVLKNIPDEPIDNSDLDEYFLMYRDGTPLSSYDVEETLGLYIMPYLFVEDGVSSNVYDFFTSKLPLCYTLSEECILEHEDGNTIYGWNITADEEYWFYEIIVHDDTGIVKKYTSDMQLTYSRMYFEHNYIGGIYLADYDFKPFLFVLMIISLSCAVRKRKRYDYDTEVSLLTKYE